ncbi:MAG: hypothetical protein AAF633_10360 [Chloroflexota bacterium]
MPRINSNIKSIYSTILSKSIQNHPDTTTILTAVILAIALLLILLIMPQRALFASSESIEMQALNPELELSRDQIEALTHLVVAEENEDEILDERVNKNSAQFGFDVAIDGNFAVVGAYQDNSKGAGVGAAYIFERSGSTWSYVNALLPTSQIYAGGFGYSVDIEGTRAVIGTQATNSIYVFEAVNNIWTEVNVIQPTTAPNIGTVGVSVALSGDTIIAGAYQDFQSSNLGSAYIFVKAGRGWSEEEVIRPSDGNSSQAFGYAVDISGDRVLIGAPGDDDNGASSGSAYLYTRSNAVWTIEQKLLPDIGAASQFFGANVALNGTTAAVATNTTSLYIFDTSNISQSRLAPNATWNQTQQITVPAGSTSLGHDIDLEGDRLIVGTNSASVFVYSRGLTTWGLLETITVNGISFGSGVAIDDEVAIIGATAGRGMSASSGTAFAYSETNTGSYTSEGSLTPNDFAAGDRFGYAVDIDGDYAAVGAFAADGRRPRSGLVYIFRDSGSGWVPSGYIQASDGVQDDRFGFAVSLDWPYIAIGASSDDNGGNDAGSVYIYEYEASGNAWNFRTTIVPNDLSQEARFGFSVDLDDGNLIVGAPFDDLQAGNEAGSAYVYSGSGASWSRVDKITAFDAAGGDRFGWGVAISEGTAIVGSLYEDSSAQDAGSAYLYTLENNSLAFDEKITPSDGAQGDLFGRSVDIQGDTAAVGAMNGSQVYIFDRGPSGWSETKILAPSGTAGKLFGFNLDFEDDMLAVGTIGHDSVRGNDAGKVYVFHKADDAWPLIGEFIQSVGSNGDHLGASVALSGETVISGADFADRFGDDSGDVFLKEVEEPTFVALTAEQTTLSEGNDSTTDYTFVISRYGDLSGSDTVYYYVPDGTNDRRLVESRVINPSFADADDFGGAFPVNNVTFASSEISKTVTISITGDYSVEDNEVFDVTIYSNAGSAAPTFTTRTVRATIQNDDTAGLSVDWGAALEVSEAGMTDTISVTLDSEPTDPVDVLFIPDETLDFGSGAGLTETIEFTPLNWNLVQTVTVAAIDNAFINPYASGFVTYTVQSEDDGDYDNLVLSGNSVSIIDDDIAGVNLANPGGLNVAEGLLTDTLSLTLSSQPTQTVTIGATPDEELDLGAGAGQAVSITFLSGDWDIPQLLIVTPIDDNVEEGAHSGQISYTVVSTDTNFAPLTLTTTLATIQDNDTAGVLIDAGSGLKISEDGLTDTLTIQLTSAPTSSVLVTADPDSQIDLGSGPGKSISVTFEVNSWSIKQTVTLTAADDTDSEGLHSGSISYSISSLDSSYDNLAVGTTSASIMDNEPAGIAFAGSSGLTAIEGGGQVSYTITLTNIPTATVSITATPDGQLDIGNSPAFPVVLSFDAGNWNLPQTISITAYDDSSAEGNHLGTILHTVSSDDPMFDGLTLGSVTVQIVDNDQPNTGSGGDGDIEIYMPMIYR